MIRPLRFPLLALAAALAMACKPAGVDDGSGGSGAADSAHAPSADLVHEPTAGETAMTHDAQTLRTIMQGLSMEMQAFSQALYVGDSAGMVARSARIADHAHMLPEEVERIKATLGPAMAVFEAADERVHLGAERLHELAIAGQLEAAAQQVGEVSQGCVACHDQFRERLRSDRD